MSRLLILCEYGTLNGGERSMLATLPGIARAGYEVLVAAPPAGPLAEVLVGRGVELVPFEPIDPSGARRTLDDRRRRLTEVVKAHRPDLLHANSLSMGRLAGPVAAELAVPSLAHVRDIISLSKQAVADLNRNDRLLAVSEAARQFHLAQGLSSAKTFSLYNGVDTAQFRSRSPSGYLHDELGLPHDRPLLATIGQIGLRKGHYAAAMALSLLEANLPFAWLIVGQRFSEKEESRQFEDIVRSFCQQVLPGRHFFLGGRDDVDRILPELTLLVHPARQEPLGRVLLEAAAAGRAIVATDVGGTREMFPPESDAAYLVPPADPPAIALAIGELLGDPARRAQLGANARSRVEAAFNVERTTAGLVECYNALRRLSLAGVS